MLQVAHEPTEGGRRAVRAAGVVPVRAGDLGDQAGSLNALEVEAQVGARVGRPGLLLPESTVDDLMKLEIPVDRTLDLLLAVQPSRHLDLERRQFGDRGEDGIVVERMLARARGAPTRIAA